MSKEDKISKANINRLDFKELIKVSIDAKQRHGGLLLTVIIDVIVSSFKYNMSYKEYRIYDFGRLDRTDRKKFMMLSDAVKIDLAYNKHEDRKILADKLAFAERFKNIDHMSFLDLKKSGLARFKDFVSANQVFIAKQVGDNQGVLQIDTKDYEDMEVLRNQLIKDEYFLVENFIVQHDSLEEIYPGSVNTLRVTTFIDEEGKVNILNTALKLGNGSDRDNFSRGGLFSVPDHEGTIIRPFVNKLGNIYESHPITDIPLMGCKIPYYKEALDLVVQAALDLSNVRYVGWDVALMNDGVSLIDGSLLPKFFQIPPVVSAYVGEEIQDLRAVYCQHMDIIK